ncbi:hypothetical protein [Nocardioides sp.]|uniref:hypothetical protein n=1 Tax=Nocardioides sp. TaxID=35761 RepID=UPI0039E597AF
MSRVAPRRRADVSRRGGRRIASPAHVPAIVEHATSTRRPDPVPESPPVARRAVALEGPGTSTTVMPNDDHHTPWWQILTSVLVALLGLAALAAAAIPVGPDWLPEVGATAVTAAYVWVLADRGGGRPAIFAVLTLLAGAIVIAVDRPELRTGAAVSTATIAAVLGVLITVPAVRVRQAVREAVVAVLVAAVGGGAALGWSPSIDLVKFEYAVLVLTLAATFTIVYRLGAGLHGLGRRGAFVVLLGAVVLAATLVYAEALRSYGGLTLVDSLLDLVRWSRDRLGAFPRPVEAVLGVPALMWGTHMRARRRQGWWVCAFGVAATAPAAGALLNPAISSVEALLSIGYGLVVGIVLGYVVIRVDLALTGTGGGRRAVGRRSRQAEEREVAIRPEPRRLDALL